MKEILIHYSGIVGVVVGAVLTWAFTEISKHLSNSYQKRQTLNGVLSLLLELYYQIKRISNAYEQSQEFIPWYNNQLSQHNATKEVKDAITAILRDLITPMISSLAVEDVQKLSVDYENALKNLSCYYPVAAYRLRGRADIKRILVDVDACIKTIEECLPVQIGEYQEIVKPLQKDLQPKAIIDNLAALREEIIELSKSTTCTQRKEIIAALKNTDAPDASVKLYMDMLKEQVAIALNNALQ